MTLKKLWQLCNDAASTTATFEQIHDFGYEVGHEPVMKLLIQREELIGAIMRVLESGRHRPDSPTKLILTEVVRRVEEAWPKEVDETPFTL